MQLNMKVVLAFLYTHKVRSIVEHHSNVTCINIPLVKVLYQMQNEKKNILRNAYDVNLIENFIKKCY